MSAWLDPEAVIGRIYEAVSAPDQWGEALEAVQRSLAADAMLLLYCDLAAGKPKVLAQVIEQEPEASSRVGAATLSRGREP